VQVCDGLRPDPVIATPLATACEVTGNTVVERAHSRTMDVLDARDVMAARGAERKGVDAGAGKWGGGASDEPAEGRAA
jgi:hypothetical protein